MKKLTFLLIACLCISITSNAQILDRLGRSAKEAAERAAERNINKEVEKGIDKAFDGNKKDKSNKNEKSEQQDKETNGWICPKCGHEGNTGKFCTECGEKQPAGNESGTAAAKPQTQRATTKYNNFDFVAGDEIIFEDTQTGEQLGEFPSQWDLLKGETEIAEVDGQNVIALKGNTIICPLMTNQYNYLGDVFTIEFDFYQFLKMEGED